MMMRTGGVDGRFPCPDFVGRSAHSANRARRRPTTPSAIRICGMPRNSETRHQGLFSRSLNSNCTASVREGDALRSNDATPGGGVRTGGAGVTILARAMDCDFTVESMLGSRFDVHAHGAAQASLVDQPSVFFIATADAGHADLNSTVSAISGATSLRSTRSKPKRGK
jgi:hypothetical protein